MKFSMILSYYKQPVILEKTLHIWANQKFPKEDYEVLIMDGGDDTGGLAIAKDYKKDYPKSQQEIDRWLTNLHRQTDVDKEILKTWFTRYGTRASEFALFAAGQASDNPLQSLPDYTQAEIIFILRNEKVIHLDDFLLRRSLIAMEGKITNELIRELSKIIQAELSWDETGRLDEITRLFDLLQKKHGFTVDK